MDEIGEERKITKTHKQSFIVIRVGNDMIVSGLRRSGYSVIEPYHGNNLSLRIFRELWFRLKLPGRSLWYNKTILKMDPKLIIIFDPLITRDYLMWLLKRKCNSKINFFYNNMVGKARHIRPDQIPSGINKWTFDPQDSRKYKLKRNGRIYYCPEFCLPKHHEPEIDILYVGRDKGRAEYILSLEREFNKLGLKTYFHIVGDTRFETKKKPYYKPAIEYDVICQLIAKSKAILNIGMENQEGITIRDTEALFNKVKLITTNTHVVEYDFYDARNIFVLGQRDLAELPDFLKEPFAEIPEHIRERYTLDLWLEEFIVYN